MQDKSAAKPMPTRGLQTTSEAFQTTYLLYDFLTKGAWVLPEVKVKSSKKVYFN